MKKTKAYTEDSVLSLSSLNHIRLRAGMYIGRLGNGKHSEDGIYVLFKEVMDNSIDEFIVGHGKQIDITIDTKIQSVSIRDYGRGVPPGKLLDCVEKINTGAKYTNDVFHFSAGLNGVGLKAVNALSKNFLIRTIRKKKCYEASYQQGILKKHTNGKTTEADGTFICFTPDKEIFGSYAFNLDFIKEKIWNYAFLNKNLQIHFNNEIISSNNGLQDLLNKEVQGTILYQPIVFYSPLLEFAFTHTDLESEHYFSFANGQYTIDGGTHLNTFKEAIVKSINEHAGKNFLSAEVREGLFGCISIKLDNPIFESQTKNKLGNTDIRASLLKDIKNNLIPLFKSDKARFNNLLNIIQTNKKNRENILQLKQNLKEKQKKSHYKIPKLRDCKYHYTDNSLYGETSTIFITEGESASASILASRNPLSQAVFSLRGKPMNVLTLDEAQMYKNEELFYLNAALGLKDSPLIQNLRYNRVILATDADVDGMHIRNLLITFFLKTCPDILSSNHLFILETPIFKVRHKDKVIYCYSEKEKTNAINQFKKTASSLEITRFKGLGEISPKEFKDFIGPLMKLTPVQSSISHKDLSDILNFFMGKNTKERKQFIIENLITNF